MFLQPRLSTFTSSLYLYPHSLCPLKGPCLVISSSVFFFLCLFCCFFFGLWAWDGVCVCVSLSVFVFVNAGIGFQAVQAALMWSDMLRDQAFGHWLREGRAKQIKADTAFIEKKKKKKLQQHNGMSAADGVSPPHSPISLQYHSIVL